MRPLLPTAVLSLLSATALQAERQKPTPGVFRVEVDPRIASYQPTRGLSGELESTASDDAVAEIVRAWADAFMKAHPALSVSVEKREALSPGRGAKGNPGPPALAVGPHFGPAGWVLSADELLRFEKEHGYRPLEIRVGLGTYAVKGKPHAIGLFVNAQNPLESVTLAQADAIFSKTRKRGYKEDITTWGQLGLKGEWASRPISIYGKNLDNVITTFFQQEALMGGAFKKTLAEQENSDGVVQAVAQNPSGMGFSGLAFAGPGVKALALARTEGGPYAEPGPASVADGSYPLSRYVYVAVDKAPHKPLDPKLEEFLRFILSRDGQEGLVRHGLLPLSAEMVKQELSRLQ